MFDNVQMFTVHPLQGEKMSLRGLHKAGLNLGRVGRPWQVKGGKRQDF